YYNNDKENKPTTSSKSLLTVQPQQRSPLKDVNFNTENSKIQNLNKPELDNQERVNKGKNKTQSTNSIQQETLTEILKKLTKIENDYEGINEASFIATENQEINLDKIWDKIVNSIIEAATLNIPKKKIPNTNLNTRKKVKKSQLHEATTGLSKLIAQGKKKLGMSIDPQSRNQINRTICHYNKNFQTDIPKVSQEWSQDWLEDSKG
ncbi:10527_t:CDS:2, partial [Dentiscutata heterogama]